MANNRPWSELKNAFNGMDRRINAGVRHAAVQSGLLLKKQIKKGIQSQSPGGVPFAPLADSTIDRKGSSKALIDSRMLINSVVAKITNDAVFVGLLRMTMHKGRGKQQSVANLGAIMEFGATIRRGNSVIIIPPRPFIQPVYEANKEQVRQIYEKAIQEAFKII